MSYLKNLYGIEKAHDRMERNDDLLKKDWAQTWYVAFEKASAKLLKEEMAKKDAKIETLLKRIDLYHDIIVGLHSDRGF